MEVAHEVGSPEVEPRPDDFGGSAGTATASQAPRAARGETGHDLASGSRADFIYHRLLASADLLSIVLASSLAAMLAASSGRPIDAVTLFVAVLAMVPVWLVIAYGGGLYHKVERRVDHNSVDEVGTILIASTAWCWLFVLVRSLLVSGPTDLLAPALIWATMIPLLLVSRSLVRRYSRRQSWFQRPVAIIGDSQGLATLSERIERHSEWGLDIKVRVHLYGGHAGVIRDESGRQELLARIISDTESDDGLATAPRYFGERGLVRTLKQEGVDRAMIAGGFADLSARTRLIHELIERGMAVDHISGGPETLYSGAVFHDLEGLPVLSVRPTAPRPIARKTKRAIDVVLATVGLALVSPLLLWAAIRIKLDSEGAVFYRQPRCGLDDQEFQLIKLRTMVEGAHAMRPGLRQDTEADGNDDVLFKVERDPRITKFGHTLRRWSIDEIPQLWNVLKGDMSMVGPRPLVFEEALQATDLFSARTKMKPGIAGPWQALGRSSIPFEDMIKLDYAYIMGWSMSEDVRLLLRTATAVIKRTGAH